MITFHEVFKDFKVDFWARPFRALDNLSFQVEEGSITGFLGANGAGKTTSLKILMGFIPASGGRVEFAPGLGPSRQNVLSQVGYLPERPYFYPHLTGREFVTYVGRLNKVPRGQLKERAESWAERFKVAFALDRKIHTYSKGMLQRVGFVSALVHDPQLIILDEPLSGLDPVGRKEIKDVIVELHRLGKTIFFSSHIVPDVEEICQSVIFIEKGQLVHQGPIDQLISDNVRPDFLAKTSFLTTKIQGNGIQHTHSLDERYDFYQVTNDAKKSFLACLQEKKVELFSLNQNKMSLEEILYKVRHGSDQ